MRRSISAAVGMLSFTGNALAHPGHGMATALHAHGAELGLGLVLSTALTLALVVIQRRRR